jgi:hypothetical protein
LRGPYAAPGAANQTMMRLGAIHGNGADRCPHAPRAQALINHRWRARFGLVRVCFKHRFEDYDR